MRHPPIERDYNWVGSNRRLEVNQMQPSSAALQETMRVKTDEELYLILHVHSQDYTPDALRAASDEFGRRKLDETTTGRIKAAAEREFEQRTERAKVAERPSQIEGVLPAFCHRCGVRLRPEAQFCQGCGAAISGAEGIAFQPQAEVQPLAQAAKSSSRILDIVVFILVFIVIAILVLNHAPQPSTSSEDVSTPAPANRPIILPPLEARFIQIVAMAQNDSRQTENDMQKGGVKAERDKSICDVMASIQVQNWIGTVQTIDSNSDGKGVLAISIAPDVLITTWNNAFSDIEAHTLIEPGSPVFESASAMKPGQRVAFSGNFFQGADGDCLLESSLTLNGKLQSPDFIFRFSQVSGYASSQEPTQTPQGPSSDTVLETNSSAVGSGATTIMRSEAAQQPAPAPMENSNAPVAQPEAQQETAPAPAENPKPPSPPNMVEIEEQAVALWNEKRYSEAAPFLIQACNYDRAYTCYYLGSMYNLGQGVAKDTGKGKQLISRACSLGYERACDVMK